MQRYFGGGKLNEMKLTPLEQELLSHAMFAEVYGLSIDEIDSEKANEITSFITKNIPLYLDDNDYKRIDSIICKEKIEQQLENDKICF